MNRFVNCLFSRLSIRQGGGQGCRQDGQDCGHDNGQHDGKDSGQKSDEKYSDGRPQANPRQPTLAVDLAAARFRPTRRVWPSSMAGFTLLEILIALSILAIGLSAAIRSGLASTETASELHARQLAGWVAENQMAVLRARRQWPALGRSSGEARMGQRQFYWQMEVAPAAQRQFRRVEVEVLRDAGGDRLARLVTYMAAP